MKFTKKLSELLDTGECIFDNSDLHDFDAADGEVFMYTEAGMYMFADDDVEITDGGAVVTDEDGLGHTVYFYRACSATRPITAEDFPL